MRIGGFLKQSLIDYPGNIASVIFTSGCNFRCFYCHNPELVLPERIKENKLIREKEVFGYLEKNKLLLDAVVITGGEPTIQNDLIEFITKVKELNLKVKLDTNGTNPEIIKSLLDYKLIDYIAMDIKAPLNLEKYATIVGKQFSISQLDKILESIRIIEQSNIPYEFRSTLIKDIHSLEDVKQMSESIKGDYYLQEYNPGKVLQDNCEFKNPFYKTELQNWLTEKEIYHVKIR